MMRRLEESRNVAYALAVNFTAPDHVIEIGAYAPAGASTAPAPVIDCGARIRVIASKMQDARLNDAAAAQVGATLRPQAPYGEALSPH